jgi:hypothetical protein
VIPLDDDSDSGDDRPPSARWRRRRAGLDVEEPAPVDREPPPLSTDPAGERE